MNQEISTLLGLLMASTLLACGADRVEPKTLDRDALMDPESCKDCHQTHYDEWSGSMHAYAADDPVFLAMNARGQRESNGELGDFCVQCHAPMAVRTGATTDGSNLADLPQHLKGVTCYFCHTAQAVEGSHNNPIALANDDVLRAAISDPLDNPAHHSGYGKLLDRDDRQSSDMCGSCHDIVSPTNVHLERTYEEWKQTLFGNDALPVPLGCGNCHMPSKTGPAADFEGVGVRELHDHRMAGVDVAITPFPFADEQRELVKDELDSTLIAQLCVSAPLADTPVDVRIENAFAGHNFPSGAAADRRAWVEIIGYKDDVEIFSSGVVAADEAVASKDDAWIFRDEVFDADGKEALMFWQAHSVESNLLPQAKTNDPFEDHSKRRSYTIALDAGVPNRVSLRLLLRPMGREIVQSLVDSGDLDASHLDSIETFTVIDTLSWEHDKGGYGCVPKDPFAARR